MTKKALITGIFGQDGSYLAEYLLQLGYQVYGLVRRESGTVRWLQPISDRLELIYGDLRDATSLEVAFRKAWPDELYNLAGQVFGHQLGMPCRGNVRHQRWRTSTSFPNCGAPRNQTLGYIRLRAQKCSAT